ncbi:ABC transporter ATP-binding protein [bacterium]|nr:ABC transporter ATP-binding protein [bacterium]
MIKVTDLHKEFTIGNEVLKVLNGINLEISEGEMISIVGVSGVGKSTFLHILGTLDKPTKGKVLYNNMDAFSLKDKELSIFRNNNIGFVFQFHHLLPEFTAQENVMIPLLIRGMSKDEGYFISSNILEKVGLKDRMNHKPGALSGGEQQRVAVARALVTEPKLIIADEPTGNLDTATGIKVFELMKDISKENKTAFIVATHNESMARQSNRMFRLKDGILHSEVL